MNKKIPYALKDFFSKEIIKLSFISFLISLLLFVIFLFALFKLALYGFEEFFVYVQDGTDIAFFESVRAYLESFAILKYLLAIEFFSTLFNILIFLNVFVILYFSFMIIYSFVIAFFADRFIKFVQIHHYSEVTLHSIPLYYMLWVYFKAGVLTLLALFLFFPLFFIPPFNLLLFIPLYYFFHKSLVMDVCSAINTKSEYLQIKKANWFELKFQTLLLFLLSIVPIVGVLFIPFYFIYIAHVIFEQTIQLRDTKAFKN